MSRVLLSEKSSQGGAGWLVRGNRLIATLLAALGIVFICIGLYLGAFAWLNDGAGAGLELLLVVGAFGTAFLAAGECFRMIAKAHAAASPRRWWLQVLLPVAAFVCFGLAAEFSGVVGDWVR